MGDYGNGRGVKAVTSVFRDMVTATVGPQAIAATSSDLTGINDSEWRRNALAERELFRRQNEPIEMMNNATLQEIVIPSTIIGALLLVLIAALGIVLTLRRHRRRGVIYHNHEIEHLHIVRKAPRAQLDSATDLELARGGGMSYPLTLTEIRD